MALNTNLAKTPAKAAVNAVVDSLDTGTGGNARVRIYSGTQPASPDVAIGTQVLLAEIDLGTNAVFGAATTGTGGTASYIKAVSSILPLSDTSANATGTAAWFRAVNKGNVAKIDGSVGAGTGFDMQIDNVSIASGQTVKLNSWTVRMLFK